MKQLSLCLLIFLLILLSFSLYSQQRTTPLLTIKNDSAEIELASLSIQIDIVGNIAQTTVEMSFYNPQDRVLEGELNFPLAEGQTVTRFAMDVNGKMREGVVVEKAKGRVAFETIVRGQVDPGLLEQTQGNNFKTRVYPIPAKGHKRVRIGYEEELSLQKGMTVYNLIMGYGEAKSFSLKATVFRQELAPEMQQSSGINFSFKKWEEAYLAAFKAENFDANKALSFQLPRRENRRLYHEKTAEGTYFYLNYQPEPITRKKKRPAAVCLLWDQSFSGKGRELEKELALLDAYFSEIGTVTVSLVPFANEVQPVQHFEVREGNWSALKASLQQLPFDGAKRLDALDLAALELTAYKADEYFLFSDGLSTIGEGSIRTGGKLLNTINSSRTADHAFLRFLAESSGGSYLNLLKTATTEASKALLNSAFRFIRAEYNPDELSALYPSLPQEVKGNFSISGLSKHKGANLTLHFGIGNEVLHSETFVLDEKGTALEGYLPKVWAGKKIGELSLQYEQHKEEITRLAKEFSIVTPNTSLIVLDAIEDYVRYEIVPPAELQEEYFELLSEQQEEVEYNEQEVLEMLLEDYQERIDWWEMDFPQKVRQKTSPAEDTVSTASQPATPPATPTDTAPTTTSTTSPDTSATPPAAPINITRGVATEDYTKLVKGKVISAADGEGIPGVNIVLRGANYGTISDMDGDFTINVPEEGAELSIRFIGYVTEQIRIGEQVLIEVTLEEDIQKLEEVVVTGYAVQQRREVTGSVVTRQASRTLQGRAAGVRVEQDIDAFYDGEGTLLGPNIGLKAYNPERPYLEKLKGVPLEELYSTYLQLREEYVASPSFYLDVGNFFIDRGERQLGIRILSGIAELELENHELLRLLAHRFRQLGEMDYSIFLFKKVLEIREEEPQSYRDLALAYEEAGEYQQALDLFYHLVKTDWEEVSDDRFPLIGTIALYEMNHLIKQHKRKLNLKHIDKKLIKFLPVDVRVVLNWSTVESDMDLWVTDPNGESCYFKNMNTHIGGSLTEDYVDGYGPEEFLLKKAIQGTYKVEVDYFDDNIQKIAGPVTLQLVIYTYYGSKKEKKEEITLQVEEEEGTITVGEFSF